MSFLRIGTIEFPQNKNVIINMMPFIIGDKASIPREYHQYWSLIEACQIEEEENKKVGYLSIVESFITSGQTQRRPGIHTDGHGSVGGWGGGWGGGSEEPSKTPKSPSKTPKSPNKPKPQQPKPKQGLYLASNINDSCRAWSLDLDASGEMGDCETLRFELEKIPAVYLKANELYWMTDRCPHESLPLKQSTVRQWFRLVTSAVDIWYSEHSTPNRLGVQAPCKILTHNKFMPDTAKSGDSSLIEFCSEKKLQNAQN